MVECKAKITYTDKSQREKDPSLVIKERLPNLIPLDNPILNPRLISLQPRNHHQSLIMREPSMSSGRIGKGVGKGNTPGGTDGADDKEFISP